MSSSKLVIRNSSWRGDGGALPVKFANHFKDGTNPQKKGVTWNTYIPGTARYYATAPVFLQASPYLSLPRYDAIQIGIGDSLFAKIGQPGKTILATVAMRPNNVAVLFELPLSSFRSIL